MGLIVDVPKAGFGNTNDGNSNRWFFADFITDVDINLVYNENWTSFKIIIKGIRLKWTQPF